MKKLIFSLLVVVFVISCGSSGSSSAVTDFKGKDWKLVEVWVDNRNINFNRKDLTNDKANHIFTLKFDAENVSGTGAPNRYSAPYTVSGNNISVKLIKATQMASLWQPEKLKEYDFFVYMQSVSEWAINGGRLELTSTPDGGKTVKLVFSL